MGDYSEDPKIRLAHSLKKRYVGVRMQQGKPILDCDWNELEDLRKHELNDLFGQFVGSGVPAGNNGFCIEPLYNGGVDIILLTAGPDEEGFASLEIDFGTSTAAGVLGFLPGNASTRRYDTVPVILAGNAAGPFKLEDEMTLTVRINGNDGLTVTFIEGAFSDIAEASAQEVVDVVNGVLTGGPARVGNGNDFIIAGGDVTTGNPGRILVEGLQALNETDIVYSSQLLYDNTALAEEWGVDVVPPLASTAGTDGEIVYLDVWEREVNYEEDEAMALPALGIETTVRLKREWAVRAARLPDDLPALKNPPPGHFFYGLARLRREEGNNTITGEMIEDLRDTQLSLKRKIDIRNDDGIVVIDALRFKQMLENTRDNAFAFIRYLVTSFMEPSITLNAGVFLGLQVIGHIVKTAEIGIGLINSDNLANRGALNFLYQMYNAENNFMTVWRDVVLAVSDKYRTYTNLIQRLDIFLHQQDPAGRSGLKPTLDTGDLEGAVSIQEEIARLIGNASQKLPRGSINVYLGKVTPYQVLAKGQHVRFEFRVESFTTMTDTYTVSILPADGWPRVLADEGGGPVSNNRVSIGASGSRETILYVDVLVGTGTSELQLLVTSDSNPTEINRLTGRYTLTEGQLPPGGDDKNYVQLEIENVTGAKLDQTTGQIIIPIGGIGVIDIRVHNFITTGPSVDSIFNLSLSREREQPTGTWSTSFGSSPLNIPANSSASASLSVKPSLGALSMTLNVSAEATEGNETFTGRLAIPLITTT